MADEDVQGQQEEGRGARIAGTAIVAVGVVALIFAAAAAAFFLLGILVYSALVRAEYPDIGSNFIPTILMVALVFWIGMRFRRAKSKQ